MAEVVRELLAEAVSALEGISVEPYYKAVTGPGRGWIEHLRTEFPGKKINGAWQYWGVVVCVPSDMAAAQKFVDEHLVDLSNALWPLMNLTQVRNEEIPQTDGQIIKAMVIEGRREAEGL
ncbi:hypothetical protein [Kribbella sp. NPDC023855]|uniref:hypothetical protein n=1 Tax=Kribbella sp. NPDC023855 TaxID=3154698 RepID=UPI0033C6DC19